MNDQEDIPLTFKDCSQAYKWPTIGALRKMCFLSQENGLGKAFIKIGRRRLVLPKALFRLLKEQGNNK